MFTMSADRDMNKYVLAEFIEKHKKKIPHYEKLKKAYGSDHDILYAPAKPKYKPDNRAVVNFPKYITDTMNGFFIGNPIKITSDDEAVSKFVEYLDQYNGQDDNNSEISKTCDIYGKGYEMYYTDEESELCITYLTPLDAFMIFDDSILHRPLYFIRRYIDAEGVERGSISSTTDIRYFQMSGRCTWTSEWEPHYFKGVPATMYVENEEEQGIFEPVMTLINIFNKGFSEKANDVDYFADAYMKVLGPKLDKGDVAFIRDNRVVNFEGDADDGIVVDFMDKPSGDATQENMLDRLERLIYQISMVANISDEKFGTTSGIALQYKLQAMKNLAKTKERKFIRGMQRRYKVLFSHPRSRVPADAWVTLNYKFTPNIPANLLEESEIAGNLEGMVSQETQLKILSVIEDVQVEIDKIKEETKPKETEVDKRMFGGGVNGQ